MRDLLLVAFLLIAIYYSFKKPYIGVAAWIWIALMAPANWTYGFSNSFRLNLTIVIVVALSYIFAKNKEKMQFTKIHFWVFLFLFWMFISTLFNLRIDSDYAWFKFTEFTKVIALFFFITLTVKTEKAINTIVWAIVLSISAYSAMEATKFILSLGSYRVVGKAGIIADRNDLAVAINMCLPLVYYLWSVTKHKNLKLGLLVLAFLNVVAIIGTYSRGGFVGLSVLVFAMWLKSNRKMLFVLLAVIILPIMYSFAPAEWKERQATVQTASTQDSSFIGRLWAWKIATLIAIDNPLTGGGFKATTDPLLWRLYANETPEFGFVDTPPIPATLTPKAAHNIYFQVLGSSGFVGLSIFLFMLLRAYIDCRNNIKVAQQYNQKWVTDLSKAISLALIAYGITGLNVSLAYFELVYSLLALVSVLYITVNKDIRMESSKNYIGR